MASRGLRARRSWCVQSPSQPRPRVRTATSVAGVPLLFPWVPVVVIPVGLPEPGLVVQAQLDPAYPLRALPEVEMGDEQPCRPAVLWLERLAVVLVRHPRFAVPHVVEREVRRVAAIAEREHVLGACVDVAEECVKRHARPRRVELRPFRHAVNVDGDTLARQGRELLPRPRRGLVDLAADLEAPALDWLRGGTAGGADAEM